MTPQEKLQNPNNLNALQDGRYERSLRSAEMAARRIFSGNRLESPYTSVTSVSDGGFPYEYNYMSADSALSLAAIGVDLEQVYANMAAAEGYEAKPVTTVTAGLESLQVSTLGQCGLQFRFKVEGQNNREAKPNLLTKMVEDRFYHSPGHRALGDVHRRITDLDQLPATITTETFDPKEDLLGSLVFLQDIEAVNETRFDATTRVRDLTTEILLGKILDMPPYRGTITETDDAYLATFGKDVKKQLNINKQTGSYQLSVSVDPATHYLETPNQAHGIKSVPFIETECASNLCRQLDEVGLMFHPKFQFEMMSTADADRYGNVYTDMSREVAKWINNPDRTYLSKLFSPIDDEYQGGSLLDHAKQWGARAEDISQQYDYTTDNPAAREASVRQRWGKRGRTPSGEAASTLLALVDGALNRPVNQPLSSELPVTSGEISIRNGACFDVSTYYVSAAAMFRVNKVVVGGVELLEKTMGSHTYMTTRVTEFNGVALPKGSLLSRADDGWAFLRLTPFTFDSDADQLAFGSELAKTRENEVVALQRLGGTTLSHLVARIS